MDRLIMESVLADVNGFNLTKDGRDGFNGALQMGFTEDRTAQVNHAFSELKRMVQGEGIDLMICKTMVEGIYDLEICTDTLDEPLRINNKAISKDMIQEIAGHVGHDPKVLLGADGVPVENWLGIAKIEIKNCEG
ncbi:hypothetical protein H9X96_02950 [Pedobacter sp. N36a]|uniref:hypothetical protein n=1 Tax=Pedobacter sp. N36a TaxID=2767996 RepID=UPI001656FD92|nr:hypothetical protein [Pedobacter sp. N36a]MBC8984729.1 hypothetical protein [Pedobacter sp. N36a]